MPASYQEMARASQRKEALAELVSQGMSISAACRQIGMSQQNGSRLWAEIKAGLGRQAV